MKEASSWIYHIRSRLCEDAREQRLFPKGVSLEQSTSSVLFLMERHALDGKGDAQPCLVFNKRSTKVRQPGDLCFPGGRILPHLDTRLSRLLKLPVSPLRKWPCWGQWLSSRKEEADELAVLLAAGMRESLEEMRLNPLGVIFLGPMQSLRLSLFQRDVYPMVAWIRRQKRFFPNWEVERIIHVPVASFLDSSKYACYRLDIRGQTQDFPCFSVSDDSGTEVLWGVTYKMVVNFLDLVFSFKPPALKALPVIHGKISEEYFRRGVR